MARTSTDKIVIVLDHGPKFSKSCQQVSEFDVNGKTKGANSSYSITKSIWTCSVEAVLEYYRIARDIFPANEKLVRFVISDTSGRFINQSWKEYDQSAEIINEAFAKCCSPDSAVDEDSCSILNGLTLAVESLTQLTERQRKALDQKQEISNCGRVICLTNFGDVSSVEAVEKHVQSTIESQNKIAANLNDARNIRPIDRCHLTILNVIPFKHERRTFTYDSPINQIDSRLFAEVITCTAGRFLLYRFQALSLDHFDLISTTVTGIPMKEEQNVSGQSANYDVEIFHRSSIHSNLIEHGYYAPESGNVKEKEAGYKTILLKWSTPGKGSQGEILQICSRVERTTTADVINRASACLTNFLLSGRSVLLEIQRKGSNKMHTHMLSAHGGHIFIHSLQAFEKSAICEEPPSISESSGGRITDYRIADFVEFMKENMLSPSEAREGLNPCKRQLHALTQRWPLTFSESVLNNMATKPDPLLKAIKKRFMTDAELTECRNVIVQLLQMESTSTALSLVAPLAPHLRVLKKDELYVQMWWELEWVLRMYASYSPKHLAVLNALLEGRRKPIESDNTVSWPVVEETKASASKGREINLVSEDETIVVFDTPESPPMSPTGPVNSKRARMMEVDHEGKPVVLVNLQQLWMQKNYLPLWSKWKDFDGRANNTGNSVELYPELMKKFRQSAAEQKEMS